MKRREFVTILGGGGATWPLIARAQQPAMPVVGYLYSGSPEPTAHLVTAFRKGLSETGYVEGQNVAIEFRWTHNDNNRLPELAAELVRRRVAVIAAPGSVAAGLAAKAATATIPIVYSGGEPVQAGLVASLSRPGGNVTGINSMNSELMAKRLGLLHEFIPGAARLAALVNPNNAASEGMITDARAAAAAIGRQIEVLTASTNRDIDAAFASLMQKGGGALAIASDPLFNNRRVQLQALATRHAVPTIYSHRDFAEAGGLMSNGSNYADLFRLTGIYVGRILKGEKPADLPVMRPTKFEFVLNLHAAKLLGLEIPPGLLAIADEVIE
jgi:putative ABC transport system substrate-binding protein